MNAHFSSKDRVFRFGGFELSPTRRRLCGAGHEVKVGGRALDLLIVLVESAGQVVGKSQLISRVWGNVVGDNNLRVHISTLRRVLGDDGLQSRYIVHAAGRGYVFVALHFAS